MELKQILKHCNILESQLRSECQSGESVTWCTVTESQYCSTVQSTLRIHNEEGRTFTVR